MANNAFLPNLQPILSAGVNPSTGLPYKMSDNSSDLKPSLLNAFRVIDRQDATNRYVWYNLPKGLTAQMIERILYYKGQGAFFYIDTNETFYFLPYALNGTIDVYGRYTGITPIAFSGGKTDGTDDEKPFIQGLKKTPYYEVVAPEDLDLSTFLDGCVLLKDYGNGISQNIIPRSQLQQPLIGIMSDVIPFMRTALLNGTGIQGMRVGSEDELTNVKQASQSINHAAIVGEKWIPLVGQLDFQDLTSGNIAKCEEFLLALQGLDNLRLSMLGLSNGGLFQKKAHMLQSEQEMNGGNVGLINQDGLTQRQEFCNIINSIWGIGIWCESSETSVGIDKNLDGEISNEQDNQLEPDNKANMEANNE